MAPKFEVSSSDAEAVAEVGGVVEAPITIREYFMCAFAAFGGIFFGYDSGYISGVLSMKYFIHTLTGLPYPGPHASAAETAKFVIPSPHQSLIVSILSAGTFFGAIIAGDVSDRIGRRMTVILGCVVFCIGVVL
jgi:MFS family permease